MKPNCQKHQTVRPIELEAEILGTNQMSYGVFASILFL